MALNSRIVLSIACTVLLVISCTVAGCASYPSPAGTPAAPSQTSVTGGNAITMNNFAFSPATLTVQPGTIVMWTNQDSVTHTVTSDTGDPVAFSSDPLPKGGTYFFTFTTPGTYSYHCSIHPSMTGTVIVQG